MTLRRSAARLAREWWPEAIWIAFSVSFCFGLKQYSGLAYVSIFSVIFWIMGHRHRRLPMQATLDGVRQDVSEVRDIIVTAVAAAEPSEDEPVRNFRVLRGGR